MVDPQTLTPWAAISAVVMGLAQWIYAHNRGNKGKATSTVQFQRIDHRLDAIDLKITRQDQKYDAHSSADAKIFAEIANSFTEISGTMKLHQEIHRQIIDQLGGTTEDIGEINKQLLAAKNTEIDRLRNQLEARIKGQP